MGDVFVSYKAEDRKRVRPLDEALEAEGLGVWWDARIGGGSPVVKGDSRFAGPGSNAILHVGSQWWNVYHAYDTLASGIPTLRIAQLVWDEGWPVPEQP